MRQSLRVDALSIPGGIHDMISLLSGKLHQVVSMAGMVSQQGQIISQACGNHGLALVVARFAQGSGQSGGIIHAHSSLQDIDCGMGGKEPQHSTVLAHIRV